LKLEKGDIEGTKSLLAVVSADYYKYWTSQNTNFAELPQLKQLIKEASNDSPTLKKKLENATSDQHSN
jgi:glucokinase